MSINYGGVFLSAVSCARQMVKYKNPGSILRVGSMSGLIANKGLTASVYNSSKAAVIQLGRSLAMEWGRIVDGRAIRVNVLCPGNMMTPVGHISCPKIICSLTLAPKMLIQNFEDDPGLRELWEKVGSQHPDPSRAQCRTELGYRPCAGCELTFGQGNMMGRISEPHEYRGAALFVSILHMTPLETFLRIVTLSSHPHRLYANDGTDAQRCVFLHDGIAPCD